MNNKIVYLIFILSLALFVSLYIFLPTIEVKDVDFDTMNTTEEEEIKEDDPIYGDIINYTEVAKIYKGNIALSRVWMKLKLIFIQYNKDIINSQMSFEEYYDNNKEEVKQNYGSESKEEFVLIMESFKNLGTDVYSATIIQDTISLLDDGIEFNISVVTNEKIDEFSFKYKFYKCKIYNSEKEKDVLFKIEPYLEVE